MMIFGNARYLLSVHETRELPSDTGSEVAFAGRSNAGKSSAINAITQHRRLAFVSRTPGRTQTINFFEFGAQRRIVDLPGYGYASVPIRERAHWRTLISAYISSRQSLVGLVLIVDARQGLGTLDEQLLRWYAPTLQPVLVLLTKADKLGREASLKALKSANVVLGSRYPAASAQLFSATAGTGVRAAQSLLHDWLK